MDPILSIHDISNIIVSICRSAVQEQTAIPLHEAEKDSSCSVTHVLQGSGVIPQQIAAHITTMFQCIGLATTLSGEDSIMSWAQAVFDAWIPHSSTITFITSGSTGEPTHQKLETVLLWQEAEELAQALLQKRKRIVATVPCHHLYGFLFAVLLPKVSALPCVAPLPFPSRAFVNGLHSGDFVVSFPLFWEGLLKQEIVFPDDVHGSTSTAPCPPATMHSLLAAGLARLTNIYGSSETGGLGYQHHPDAPLTLFAFWRRVHLDDPDESWIERIHPSGTSQQPVVIPDHVEWFSSRCFSVRGRKDKIVQVGGLNVSLSKTVECMRSHPDVRDCAVRLMRPEEGNRLKAFVIPKTSEVDMQALRSDLYSWCRSQLRPAERPKKITFGSRFPVTSMGKNKDWN